MTAILTPQLLESAAAVVRSRGLCQMAYTDETESVCILGAVAVARGYPLDDPAMWGDEIAPLDEFVEEPMDELAVLMGCDPVAFSDDYGRTADEVAEALLEAARKLDA